VAWIAIPGLSFQSRVAGDTHEAIWSVGVEEEPLADVRSTPARSAEIDRPEGIARAFHVSLYKVEPSEAVTVCNLLTKDRYASRLSMFEEVEPRGPKVPLVINPSAFACRAERLARTTAGPDRSVVGPSGLAQGVAPDPNACEKVALGVSHKVGWKDIFDASFVNVAGRNVTGSD
jgi:hypothetical protein